MRSISTSQQAAAARCGTTSCPTTLSPTGRCLWKTGSMECASIPEAISTRPAAELPAGSRSTLPKGSPSAGSTCHNRWVSRGPVFARRTWALHHGVHAPVQDSVEGRGSAAGPGQAVRGRCRQLTSNGHERENDSRTDRQSPVRRRLELGEEHQFLQPLIDTRRTLAGNDFEVVDHPDSIELRLDRQGFHEFRADTQAPQRRVRRAGRLVDPGLKYDTVLSYYGTRFGKTSKKNSKAKQGDNNPHHSRHSERFEDVVEPCLPSIAKVIESGVRQPDSCLQLQVLRHRPGLRTRQHVAQ